jgi:phytoene desaturase
MEMKKKVIVIGGGFAGLSAACSAAQQGNDVLLLEKNSTTGGRARSFSQSGYTFDMGPSWYWMPEIFEDFFNKFGKKVSDYYEVERLDPSYRVFFADQTFLDVPANYDQFKLEIEKLQSGSGAALDAFLQEAKVKYDSSMSDFVWKPSLSITEFFDVKLIRESFRLQLFSSFTAHAKKYFSNPKILQLLEFPVLFLGAKPENTPAMYSMMNYADIVLGTWYPKGGMIQIVHAMTSLAKELGVDIRTTSNVQSIEVSRNKVTDVIIDGHHENADAVIAAADYHHVEQDLLKLEHRSYSKKYWNDRTMSPSALIFYLGVNKRIEGLQHHNLFFDEDFKVHAKSIYDEKNWPKNPLFYVCCASKSDTSVAPDGCENVFILIPVATGLTSSEEVRANYLHQCIARIKKHTGEDISKNIVFSQSYAHEEFERDYHSFRGNAYGLSNTLRQTAIMKPKMRSKKVSNLFYAGQLTVPGPGVPPAIMSGQIAATEIEKYFKRNRN